MQLQLYHPVFARPILRRWVKIHILPNNPISKLEVEIILKWDRRNGQASSLQRENVCGSSIHTKDSYIVRFSWCVWVQNSGPVSNFEEITVKSRTANQRSPEVLQGLPKWQKAQGWKQGISHYSHSLASPFPVEILALFFSVCLFSLLSSLTFFSFYGRSQRG